MELAQFAILVPIVIGVVQVIKTVGLPNRFAPLASLVLGIAGAVFLVGGALQVAILQGIIVGLTASGLYSGTKATFSSNNG